MPETLPTSPYTKEKPLNFSGQAFFWIEGTLSRFQSSPNPSSTPKPSGADQAVDGQSMAQRLQRNETHRFSGFVDDTSVYGNFEFADKIQEGDLVKAVVVEFHGTHFVHAILNARSGVFYMPSPVALGSKAVFRDVLPMTAVLAVFGWIAAAVILGVCHFLGLMEGGVGLQAIGVALIAPAVLVFLLGLWMSLRIRGEMSGGHSYADVIFKVFGFPTPEKIDLHRHSSLSDGQDGGWPQAWRADTLLQRLTP
jgi:hypothetical protein